MPRRLLFNDGWEFVKTALHTSFAKAKVETKYQFVDIPHDWLIYDTKNFYEDSTGWYKKTFVINSLEENIHRSVRFEGVYMDSAVYVNDHKVGEWKYGYSTFEFDITKWVREGENTIYVSVHYQNPNSRWYSGAGIYRNVWLIEREEEHIAPDGLYISTRKIGTHWIVDVETALQITKPVTLRYSIGYSKKSDDPIVALLEKEIMFDSNHMDHIESDDYVSYYDKQSLRVPNPYIWDIKTPELYHLFVEVIVDGRVVDGERQNFGFRSVLLDPDYGILLNGRKIKLNGVCEHHDLGALGAAFNKEAMRRKFKKLQAMGVNAIRTTHNMPAPELMDLADEMGILVVSEAFDMWERSKTDYDYARFFKDWYKKDVKSWVKRDRNHPSLILWSIGNEIYDTHADERGQEITKMLMNEVHRYDPKMNAKVTIGSNYMPWENARKCADIVKVAGYNYAERCYYEHHKDHKDWIIYGSETSSTVQSRGIYHFPFGQSILSDDDLQCSSLGNSITSWGAKSTEACITADRDATFSIGQFLWTGFDYIGEPTPYHTKNSYFGQIDTAGFEKDSFYIYQAEWTDYKKEPMVHIFPYWDFNEGQTIDVRVCSNAPVIELLVNQKSFGKYKINHKDGKASDLVATYQVPYEKGELIAYAYDEDGRLIAVDTQKSFGEASEIILKVDKTEIYADGRDLSFITISMADQHGNPVENANNRVHVEVEGAGRLLGLDNGDSTDYDQYKGTSRRLFSGKLLAIIGAKLTDGEIKVTVSSEGLKPVSVTLQSKKTEVTPVGLTALEENSLMKSVIVPDICNDMSSDIPVRKIELAIEGEHKDNRFTKEDNKKVITAKILPENATDQELIFAVVNDLGSPSKLATIKREGNRVTLTANGDGVFRLRCMSKSGTDQIRIISQYDFVAEGLGIVNIDPYEFVSASNFSFSKGDYGNGNERGISTSREGETQIGFTNIDFGEYGSDEVTLPIFTLEDGEYSIQIWEGRPNQPDSCLVADVIYNKKMIWNTYQEETYHLSKRLKGITDITFVFHRKAHLKGFYFTRQDKAYSRLTAGECDVIYGDTFERTETSINNIGNNVSIVYRNMDFKDQGTSKITICGRSLVEKTSIHICYKFGEETKRQLIEFPYSEHAMESTFDLDTIVGQQELTFVFLPGSKFDFNWFCFM